MARQFKDYDALAGAKEPIRFRIAGEDHELPADLPAKLVMDVRRQTKQSVSDEDAEDFGFQIIERLLTKERFDRIVEAVGIETLGVLMEDIMREYGFGGEDDPKAEAPATEESPSTTSSNIGEPSTQTSNVFGLRPAESSTPEPSASTG